MSKNASKILSLNQRMRFIGIRIVYDEADLNLSGHEKLQCDIEKTLIDAAYEAKNDFRLLSLLMSWLTVHGDYVIVEKLFKLAKLAEKDREHNPIMNGFAVCGTINGYLRFKRYVSKSPQDEFLIDQDTTESFGTYQGYKQDWSSLGVKVPLKMIRIRETDVLSAEELARFNLQFRNRLLVGASWRADILTAVDLGIQSATEISKTLGCSYEPAHRVLKEYSVVKKISLSAA